MVNPFDRAWALLKMPLWTEEGTNADYEPEVVEDYYNGRYLLVPEINDDEVDNALMGNGAAISMTSGVELPRFWESKNKDARGFASFREGNDPDDPKDPYHQLSLFEMARDARGKDLARDRLREMMAELREQDPEATSTHVTHSEKDTADFWDKMVDEELIDSASTKPWVTTTPDGKLIPKIRPVKVIKQDTRQTELGEFPGFEDAAFSSHGPITNYHGTTVGPAAAIDAQGLQPRLPYEAQLNQAQMAARLQGLPVKDWDPEGVYASKRQKDANRYASWRGQDRNQAPAVFGIRGGGLDFQHTAPDGYLGYYPEAVPRSRLVRVE